MSLPCHNGDNKVTARSKFFASLQPGQLLESLFDAIPGVSYFVKDRECRFMGGSLSFAKAMGESTVEALIGNTDYNYSPDFLADAFYADDQLVMSEGKAIFGKVELVPSADGSLDWLCTTKIPLFDIEGAVVGLAGVSHIIRDSDTVYSDHPEIRRIVDFVRKHYRNKLSISDMANEGGISVSTQERLFRKLFGLTPLMYLQKTRLNAACVMLRKTDIGLARIAVECGFNDQTSMTRLFRLELKITPLKYRRRFSSAKLSHRKSSKNIYNS
ncbi:AraC family transcriptional regulator [Coraliomargarita algicola]|uniref:AraC family transcriptional regulator n=1 Tax=Coraliomargarita algicola TaxID=3092156 RepID=A0ABZ0RJG3_9BACT|nr:AraC family transcriptional regulator [Coraliomargarita sp. J2-16]WPJ96212.1 AraC family transcriptional regulator [Coraliomargarita sp. J2-16]